MPRPSPNFTPYYIFDNSLINPLTDFINVWQHGRKETNRTRERKAGYSARSVVN